MVSVVQLPFPPLMFSSALHWGFPITLIAYLGMKASVGYYITCILHFSDFRILTFHNFTHY